MRFARLRATSFGCIETVDVTLGPGLNVLFGPNDLGKSTLGGALRAALLLRHDTAAARDYVPWQSDAVPSVVLELCEANGMRWRVEKFFGSGRRGSALLERSRDGHTWSVDAKGRAVDQRLRELMGFGIAGPGGAGGRRGLPESFLTGVLLAEQTAVVEVLDRSLEGDSDSSGKERLTAALQALAQDPLFASVLESAQARVDVAYTATGQRRRGRGSPFVRAAERIQRLQAEYDLEHAKAGEADRAQEAITALSDRRLACEAALAAARQALAARRAQRERGLAREVVAQRVAKARTRQAAADQDAQRAQGATAELQRALDALADAKRAARQAGERVGAARAELANATEQRRLAEQSATVQEQTIARQELENRALTLAADLRQVRDRAAVVRRARDLAREADAAGRVVAAGDEELHRLREARDGAARSVARAVTELTELAGVEALLRVRQVEAELSAAEAARDEAHALRERAAELRQGAAEGARADLPASERVRAFSALDEALRIAEAKTDAKVRVEIEPLRPFALRTRVDGEPPRDRETDEPLALAGSEVELTLRDLARVVVTPGDGLDASAASDVVTLRQRWEREVRPALQAAGVATVADLVALVGDVEVQRERGARAVEQASELEARAVARAEAGAQVDPLVSRLAQRQRQLAGLDQAALARRVDALGSDPHEELLVARAGAERGEAAAREVLAQRERALTAWETRCQQERNNCERVRGESSAAAAQVGGPWQQAVAEVRRAYHSLRCERRSTEARLAALTVEQDSQLGEPQRLYQEAQSRLAVLQQELDATSDALDRARVGEAAARREHDLRREQADAHDLGGIAGELAAALAELERHPAVAVVTDADLDAGERAVATAAAEQASVQEQLLKATGALETVGGHVASERATELERALQAEQDRLRQVETQFEGWRLLRDTLRAVENEQGTHLGRAIAGPITERFAELTGDRYGSVSFGSDLGEVSLEAAGASRRVEALSVGTQEQLATLFRLCIAEQLGTAIVLDDHLTQTDHQRFEWFRVRLREVAQGVQVVVLTCRPHDYLMPAELPPIGAQLQDADGGRVRAIDLSVCLQRAAASSRL
ncbi:MAG: hypothetical protein AAF628_02780 [Planctomycetota bacterium]